MPVIINTRREAEISMGVEAIRDYYSLAGDPGPLKRWSDRYLTAKGDAHLRAKLSPPGDRISDRELHARYREIVIEAMSIGY